MPSDEEAKAAQEIAKAVGSVIDGARDAGGWLSKLFSGLIEDSVGLWHDRIRIKRKTQLLSLEQMYEKKAREMGMDNPTREIPLSTAVPLLEAASIEEDAGMLERWANLLVNATNADSPIGVKRVFVSILSELSPLEAQLLDRLYPVGGRPEWRGLQLRESRSVSLLELLRTPDELPELTRDESIAVMNLNRLGLLKLPETNKGVILTTEAGYTFLGEAFVDACRLEPKVKD